MQETGRVVIGQLHLEVPPQQWVLCVLTFGGHLQLIGNCDSDSDLVNQIDRLVHLLPSFANQGDLTQVLPSQMLEHLNQDEDDVQLWFVRIRDHVMILGRSYVNDTVHLLSQLWGEVLN